MVSSQAVGSPQVQEPPPADQSEADAHAEVHVGQRGESTLGMKAGHNAERLCNGGGAWGRSGHRPTLRILCLGGDDVRVDHQRDDQRSGFGHGLA